MSRLEVNAYYALGAPLCLLLMGVEYALARRRGQQLYRLPDTLANLSGGLGEVMIGLLIGPLLLGLYDFGYQHLPLVRWPEGSAVPWVLAFLLGDLCYYAYHRAGHRVGALWAIHGVHHQSEQFNVSIALRHPWFSDVYSFVFYIPLPLLGVPPTHFFVAISVISFYAVSVHSRAFRRTGLWFLVSPQTHELHHAINKPYLGRNYGAMFTLWDRLFGTHADPLPEEPPRIGTTFAVQTHSGARAQVVFFQGLLQLARRAARPIDALKVLWMPPGWAPPGVSPPPRGPLPRDEADIPASTRGYALLQFAGTTVFAFAVLWRRDAYPFALHLCATGLVLVGLWCVGALLDGDRTARGLELARLTAVLALGLALLAAEGYQLAGLTAAAWAVASAGWLLGPRTTRSSAARSEAGTPAPPLD